MSPHPRGADGLDLDDPDALERADPSAMLRVVAGAGAQVRASAGAAAEAGVQRLAQDGRPRAVVVAGVGVSGLSGEVLAALAGLRCPVPVVLHRDVDLPRWVGAADVVCGVSASGHTEETLSAVEQAVSRGCSLLGVGAGESQLAELVERGRGVYVPVPAGGPPRASFWALSAPLLLAGRALGLLGVEPSDLGAAADRLDAIAEQCRPTSESFVNPGKHLALDLSGTLPVVWGASAPAGVAARRMACQLAENAKYPALSGELPEAGYHQIAVLSGAFGSGGPSGARDIFADPDPDPDSDPAPEPVRLHLVLLRDPAEHPRLRGQADAAGELAREAGVGVTELLADGAGPVERLASLVGLLDFASVYLALAYAVDPTPTGPVAELRARSAR